MARHLSVSGLRWFSVTEAFTHCSFTGFGNPSVNDDLALLRLANPLPVGLGYPTLGSGAGIGDVITLVGFGRSGNSTNASLTDRRYGSNVIDRFNLDDEGSGAFEIFRCDPLAPECAKHDRIDQQPTVALQGR